MGGQTVDPGEDEEMVRDCRRTGNWSAQVQADDPDLLFFRLCGLKKLGFNLVASSLRDLLAEQAGQDLDAPERISAHWLETEAGRAWLEFLIPQASADAVIARINDDPERILRAIDARVREFQPPGELAEPGRGQRPTRAADPPVIAVATSALALGVHTDDPRLAEQISAVILHKPIFDQLELDLMSLDPYPMGASDLAVPGGQGARESSQSRPSFA
jgi:hypothetical protein